MYKGRQHTIVIMIIMSYIIYFGMYTLVASFMTFAVWFPLALGGGGGGTAIYGLYRYVPR